MFSLISLVLVHTFRWELGSGLLHPRPSLLLSGCKVTNYVAKCQTKCLKTIMQKRIYEILITKS